MCRLYGTVLRLILARIYGPIITLNKEAFYGGLTHRQRVSWLIHTYCVWLVVLPYHGTNEMVHLKKCTSARTSDIKVKPSEIRDFLK